MATRSRVAVLRTTPTTVLQDIERLADLAGVRDALARDHTTILKDNISWHFPFPGANTTPWQLEGTIQALRGAGFGDLVCVQNKTVVTNAFKGEDLNHYVPLFRQYDVPVLYNFRDADMKWIEYKPKAKMHVLDRIFPEGIRIPDYFVGKNIVHLPTTKCVTGDAVVVLGDGTRVALRDLFERGAKGAVTIDGDRRVSLDVDVLAMDPGGRVRPQRARWAWRTQRRERRVFELTTVGGRTLTATADHPLWTPVGWRAIGDLRPGERVATAAPAPVAVRAVARAGEARVAATTTSGPGWDEVATLAPVSGEVDLYDLTVPGAGSFVANGLVVHNCHIYTTTTGAMKNAFGGLLNTKRHYTHSWIHATLVDLLAIQKEIHSGLFAIMDGTTAGNGPGPRTMFPVIKNVMLASADQVAIDAVAAKMMGFDPMQLDYVRLAHEAKLGIGRPDEIEIVGDVDAARENWGFRVGDNGASRIGDMLWFGPLKSIQNLFFRTPLVHAFIFGSEAYHDFYRWPAKDRLTFERWQRDTDWGRLFERYGQQSPVTRR